MSIADRRVLSAAVFVIIFMIVSVPQMGFADEYRLGIGDGLQISVWGHPELTTEVEVRPDGYITFPLVGDRFAVGRSVTELGVEIEARLTEYVVNPRVTVMVRRFRTISVQVLGESQNAGYYQLRANSRLMDAIGAAGGPNRMADLTNVSVTRYSPIEDKATLLSFNVDQYISNGQLTENPVLEEGDIVSLFAAGKALILGEISNPAGYNVGSQMDLLDVVAQAGGALESADLENVVITRGEGEIGREFIVNLRDLMSSQGKGSIFVHPNDVVFIPAKKQVIILGDVRSPGTYPLRKDSRLLDVIGSAGGLLPTGDASRVSITRTYGENQNVMTIDAKDALSGREGGENPPLSGGDIIFIPSGNNHILVMGQVRSPGSYNLRESTRVLDAIGLAGGFTDRAAQNRVTLTREVANQLEIIDLDVDRMQRQGTGQDVRVQPGDVLFVPEGAPEVLVLGAVRNAGSYRVHAETRLLDVLAMAGGSLERAGDKVLVTRDEQTTEVDLGVLSRLGIGNDPVFPGDVVYVTEGQHQVLVLGEVRNPGYHRLNFGDRVLDGIALAGGLLDSAAQEDVTVTRQLENDSEVFPINISRLMQNRFMEDNVPLEGGDIIIVPEVNRRVLVLGEVRSPGYYQVGPDQKALDVLGMAGGMNDRADQENVRLTRYDDEGTSLTESLNMSMVMQGQGGSNPRLVGGDVLYIPERRAQVLVFGEVRAPGYYPVSGTTRLLDAIARAGGLTDAADGSEVTFAWEADGETRTESVDVSSVIQSGQGNRALRGGEMILVPRAERDVLILGEVARSGVYTMRSGERILDVVARAGGLTENADAKNTTLTRQSGDNQPQSIDLQAIVENSRNEQNIVTLGGDVIFVPRANREVLVLGEVARPGMYTVRQGERILDVMARAGGPTDNAELAAATLTRQQAGDERVHHLDFALLFEDSNHSDNIAVQGGDVLFIPETNRRVLVLGQVQRPGAYAVDQNARVLDIIALAGGPTERADIGKASLTRQDGDSELLMPFNLEAILAHQEDNFPMQGGDVVHIPQSRQIIIMGEVTRPGSYNLPTGGRMLDVLALAGGMRNNFERQDILLTRQGPEGEQVWYTTYEALMNQQAESNLLVDGGDVLYVPEVRRQILVLGEVARPGVYNVGAGSRVLDAIALAGGPTDRAALEAIGIYRDGDVSEPSTLVMGKDKLLFQGHVEENPEIRGGDVIYVPETRRPNWTNIFGIIGGLRTFQQLILGF